VLAAITQVAGNRAIGQDFSVRVDVAKKEIQCRNALGQAAFNAVPFLCGDQSRQQVIGKNAFSAFIATLHSECDALGEERKVRRLFSALQFIGWEAGESFSKSAIWGAQAAVSLAHFVVGLVEGIVSEEGLQFHWMAGAHAYSRTFFVDSRLAGKRG
jgi:hypothetical protein